MSDEQMPIWVAEAVAAYVHPTRSSYPLEPGAICVADAPLGSPGDSHLVVVVAVDSDHNLVEVVAATELVEYESDEDLYLAGDAMAAGYPLLVEPGIRGVLLRNQLRDPIAFASADVVSGAAAERPMRNGNVIPLTGPEDPRWQFKEQELEALNLLSAAARGRALDGDDELEVLDPTTIAGLEPEFDQAEALTIADDLASGDLITSFAALAAVDAGRWRDEIGQMDWLLLSLNAVQRQWQGVTQARINDFRVAWEAPDFGSSHGRQLEYLIVSGWLAGKRAVRVRSTNVEQHEAWVRILNNNRGDEVDRVKVTFVGTER